LSAGKAKRITRRPGATTAASADPQRHRGNWVIITISDALTKGEPRLVELGEATSSARPAGPTRTSGATNRPLGLNASSAARSSPSAAKTTSTPTSASRPRLVEPALTPAPATTSGTSSSPEPAGRRVACVDGMQQARSTSGDPASTSLPWWPRREASKRCRRCSMSVPEAQTRPDSANPPTAGIGRVPHAQLGRRSALPVNVGRGPCPPAAWADLVGGRPCTPRRDPPHHPSHLLRGIPRVVRRPTYYWRQLSPSPAVRERRPPCPRAAATTARREQRPSVAYWRTGGAIQAPFDRDVLRSCVDDPSGRKPTDGLMALRAATDSVPLVPFRCSSFPEFRHPPSFCGCPI
jgi:hypothetical protein